MASSARIEELEKKFNENPRRYFAPLANEYRKAGQIEQAIALCRAYLPQQPGHMSGHIVFGQSLFDAGEFDEAQGVFQTALTLDPENLIALRHLGDIAQTRGDTGGARAWYQRVLDADPRNEEIAELLANLDAAPAGAAPPVASTAAADGATGWGDINPESGAAPPAAGGTGTAAAAEAPGPADDELVIEHVSASADELAPTPPGPPHLDKPPAEPAGAELEVSVAVEATELATSDKGEEIDLDALFDAPATPAEAGAAKPTESAAGRAESTGKDATKAGSAGSRGAVDDLAITAEMPAPPAGEPAPPKHQSPDAPKSDELELEPAEFVPPAPTTPVTPALGFETGHESVVGGPIGGRSDPGDATGASTPAAFVTETMAELYLQQGFMQEALDVYRKLLEMSPDDEGLRERVAQLEQGARSSVSMAAVSDEVVDAARRRQSSPARRSMRAFLGALAARRPPARPTGDQEAVPSEPGQDLPYIENAPEAATSGPYTSSSDASAPAGDGDETFESIVRGSGSERPGAPAPPPARTSAETPRRPSTPHSMAPSALDALFNGAPPTAEDQAAAVTLAGAFDTSGVDSVPRIVGRPTRTAPTELSLDLVFRESGGDAGLQRPRSDFSFDQFFSDDADDAEKGRAAVAETDEEPASRPGRDDDIGQFNAWLEGLKKK